MDEEEAKPYEPMNSGRRGAEEKEKQKATDLDAEADDLLPPAALIPQSAGEPEAGDDAAANWHTGAGCLFGTPSGGTSEIEELPPSPPRPAAPSPSSSHPDLLPALNAEDAWAAELDAVPVLEGLEAALESPLQKLERLRREREALEEFWKPVVPDERHPHAQRQCNKMSKAELEYMKAMEEFWKPVVPVPQRNCKSKINCNCIISLIALTCGLVLYICLWTLLPFNNLSHIVGTISILWILLTTFPYCQRFRTTRIINHHIPRLIFVCYWPLLLYLLYLIVRIIQGTFAGYLFVLLN